MLKLVHLFYQVLIRVQAWFI